jgi:Co/Zn/Cd efflux system component
VAGPNAKLTNNLMLGIGLSGLIVNAVRMVFLAAVKNLNIEAQMFFYGSALFLAVCTCLSYVFVKEYSSDPLCLKYRQAHSIK